MRKKSILLLVLIVSTCISVKVLMFKKTDPLDVPELLASSRSKEFCSCYFILKNSKDYCLDQVLKGYPLFDFKIGDGLVEFSNPLYSSTSVVSKDRKYGCHFKKE